MSHRQLLKSETGYSWNAGYAEKFGKLKHFLTRSTETFKVEGQMVYLLPAALAKFAPASQPSADDDALPLAGASDAANAATGDDATAATQARHDETDAEFAARLAAAEDAAAAGTPAPTEEGEWQTPGRRRNRGGKQRHTAASPAPTPAPAPAPTPAPRVLTGAELQRDLAEKWGRWFVFNDTKVTPINVSSIENAFQGNQCAYMLMYRARKLAGADATPLAGAATDGDDEAKSAPASDGASEPPTAPPPKLARQTSRQLAQVQPPEYWKTKVGVLQCGSQACCGATVLQQNETALSGGGAGVVE